MTNNIDRAAEIIGQHVKCGWSICERRRRSEDGKLPPLDACGNTNPSCRDVAEGIAQALADAGCRVFNLPEPIINDDDGNPEWHADEHTVDVDRGMVGLWTPDGTHWEQTPNQARNLALALLAAADYAEREEVTDE